MQDFQIFYVPFEFRLHDGLKAMGLELFVENSDARLPTVTTIKVIFQYMDLTLTQIIMQKHCSISIHINVLIVFLGTRRNRLEGSYSFLYEES